MSRLKDWRNKLDGDFSRVKTEWAAYKAEIRDYTIPGLKDAIKSRDVWEILHKLTDFGGELPDQAPRITWYLGGYIIVPLAILGWVT